MSARPAADPAAESLVTSAAVPLAWLGIIRLGLVQTALGAIVVLTTSTLNRVMVVELMLPAMLPGALVGLHYAVQLSRPRMGHGSDQGGHRTPWIIGGMAVLALGAVLAALATSLLAASVIAGTALAVLAFLLIGGGVGAAGTSLLVLLATRVDGRRRAAAATICWVMMIVGFILTAGVAGHFLDPFSMTRLVAVTAVVCVAAWLVASLAVRGIERRHPPLQVNGPGAQTSRKAPFRVALLEVWAEPEARLFSAFVFVSMLAYSAQDLILEPYAGAVFGFTPGESTRLAGIQHAGVLSGMVMVALLGTLFPGRHVGALRTWTVLGCVLSAVALLGIAAGGWSAAAWPLRQWVFALGLANGAFAVAAIGSMMALVRNGASGREGVRMGVWGAAQALAFGLGGFLGTVAVDLSRALLGSVVASYSVVFAAEASLFLLSAVLAVRVARLFGRHDAPGIRFRHIGDGHAPELSQAGQNS